MSYFHSMYSKQKNKQKYFEHLKKKIWKELLRYYFMGKGGVKSPKIIAELPVTKKMETLNKGLTIKKNHQSSQL